MLGMADQHEAWRAFEPGTDPGVSDGQRRSGIQRCQSEGIVWVSGLSRAQVTRLIGKYAESGTVQVRRSPGRRFTSQYNPADIGLLALVDVAHDTLSGPATQKILYREFFEFAGARCERLANISVAYIYNLRKHRSYREKRMVFHKTRPTPVSIGERRRLEPKGRPGYLGQTW